MSAFNSSVTMRPTNRAEKKFLYLLIGIVTVIVAAFAVAFLFPKGNTVSGVKPDQTFTQGDNSFTYAGVSHDKTTYQLNFYVSNNQIDPLSPIIAKVRTGSSGNGTALPAKLTQVSEDFYSLRVKKVPAKQPNLYVSLGTKKQLNGGISMQSSQAISLKQAHSSRQAKTATGADLNQDYYQYMVHFYSLKMKKARQKIAAADSNIATLKHTLKKQKASLEMQSGSQKTATKQKISDTETSLKSQQNTRKDQQDAVKNARAARKKYQNQVQ